MIFFVFLFIAVFNNCVDAIKVSIYYESLCPDSINFIVKQLYPHYNEIEKYVNLDFIPYGKATHENRNGTYKFSCQHGPSECKGNMYHSCVLFQNSGQEKNVEFLGCLMRKRNPDYFANVRVCAQRFGLNVSQVEDCMASGEAEKLLAQNGDRTWSLDPNLSFVPTIIYDDTYDDTSQWQSIKDFVAVVCNKIVDDKPRVCNGRKLPNIGWW